MIGLFRRKMLILFTLLFVFSCEEEVEKTKPLIDTLVVSVYGSVLVQPDNLYNVFAESSGILEELDIVEGDLVKKGQTLAKIKSINQDLKVNTAKIDVDYAAESLKKNSAQLTSILDEISTIKRQISNDSINYFRQKNLWDQNIGSKSTLDNKKLQYDLMLSNLSMAQKRYVQTKLDLENRFKQSQNNFKQAKSTLKDVNIYSKKAGKIYTLNKNEGEYINPQEILAQIGDEDSFFIEIQIDEVDIAKLSIGQKMIISLDAYVDQVFEAKLTKIYPQKNIRTQTFKIEGVFIDTPKKLYAGLSGEANIIIQEKKNVLSIPLDYLNRNSKVVVGEEEIDVVLGQRNMDRIEVVSGIDSSSILTKPQVQ